MATIYYTASSLDGFMADRGHTLSWLLSRDVDVDGPMGYRAFEESVGALVMGATTYRWVQENLRASGDGWPYAQPCRVFTRTGIDLPEGADIRPVSGAVEPVHAELLHTAGDRNVWVVGGGGIAGAFLDAGLLDEVWIQYAPVTLGGGTPVLPREAEFDLAEVVRNRDFVCARWIVRRD